MAKTKARGAIVVRFPPPVPADFGRALKAAILERLGPGDECCTSNTGALGGPPGWAFDIRIKRPEDTAAAAVAVAGCLAPLAATMEVSERRGPVEVPLTGGGWDAGLLFPDGTDAWADLYLTLPAAFGERDAVVTAARDAVAPHGTVTHAVKLSTLNLSVRVADARNAAACVAKLAGWLSGAGAKLSACTQSRPVVTVIGGAG
ncbi:MAG TPA: hypothetical protein VGE74_11930 [Gemmata sp.]